MKKSFLLAAAALTLGGSAFAADLPSMKGPAPVYAPPPPVVPWTGFFVGLNAGGTWNSNNSIGVASGPLWAAGPAAVDLLGASSLSASGYLSPNQGGFMGGAQIGYNWQVASRCGVGVEADIQGVTGGNGASRAATAVAVPGGGQLTSVISASRSLDYLGTVRGRAGYLVMPTLLVYGTAGLAYAGVTSNTSIVQGGDVASAMGFAAGQYSDTRVGWTAGGGLEWMFMPNWSAKVEYLYYDLNSLKYASSPLNLTSAAGAQLTSVMPETRTRLDGHIVRAGANYHFNWGAPPVVAKY